MASTRQNRSSAGSCPECGTALTPRDVLIQYRTEDGATAAWADCPECRDVVHPA